MMTESSPIPCEGNIGGEMMYTTPYLLNGIPSWDGGEKNDHTVYTLDVDRDGPSLRPMAVSLSGMRYQIADENYRHLLHTSINGTVVGRISMAIHGGFHIGDTPNTPPPTGGPGDIYLGEDRLLYIHLGKRTVISRCGEIHEDDIWYRKGKGFRHGSAPPAPQVISAIGHTEDHPGETPMLQGIIHLYLSGPVDDFTLDHDSQPFNGWTFMDGSTVFWREGKPTQPDSHPPVNRRVISAHISVKVRGEILVSSTWTTWCCFI